MLHNPLLHSRPEPHRLLRFWASVSRRGRSISLSVLLQSLWMSSTGCAMLPEKAVRQIDQAKRHYAASQYNEAKRLLNMVISEHAKTQGVGEAYYVRGLCLLHQTAQVQAMNDFKTALRTTSNEEVLSRTHAQIGHLLYEQERFTQAEAHYHKALQDFPPHPPRDEILFRYGDVLQKLGQWEQSRTVLPKVWHLFPESRLASYARRKAAWPHDYFSIQCGAFNESAKASELADALRRQRFDATVSVDIRAKDRWHVVYVGSFPIYGDAQIELRRVLPTVPDAFIVP